LVYKSIQRKKLTLSSILSIFLLGGLAAMGTVLSVNLTYGQHMQRPDTLLCDIPVDMTRETWYIYQESIYGSYEAMPQQVKDQNACAVGVEMFGKDYTGYKQKYP